MDSSNKQLHNLAAIVGVRANPGFPLIVAFDFYDGLETGLALYPSGAGVRFSSIGDSRSRLFRAFELVGIEGTWWQQVQTLTEGADVNSPGRILLPSAGEELAKLKKDVFDAAAGDYFVGIGSAYLDWLAISAVTRGQLAVLRTSPIGFRLTHQMLKRNFKRINGLALD